MFGRRPTEAVRRLENGTDRADLDPGVTAAVIDASFTVEPGEIFVVMGLSGSGKSTLLRTLNGLLPATSGRVLVDENDLTGMSPAQVRDLRQRRMSMVFQHFALFPHRTVAENVAYGLSVQGAPRERQRARTSDALELVGLTGWEDRLPGELSGGMRQRVGLARALAADTEILLMDEAFSALDPLIRKEMQDQLLNLQRQLGKTIVFITHDLNEAMRLGDRIAMMRDGRIVQIATAQEMLTTPADDYVTRFVRDVDRTRVLTASAVMEPAGISFTTDTSAVEARETMLRHELTGVLVTSDGRFAGAVTRSAVSAAADRGEASLEGVLDRSAASTTPETPVAELFGASASAPAPLAVVDQHGALLGMVTQQSLLRSLSMVEDAQEEVDAHA
ncbi:quaternary amine ABC transporter ATP-binding protein [Amycolatopsis jiangsuensis]|uniref:Glycine betaine/proline transport system ATP-binding protein n=1 Tax=Amycolatopsis jiangsuensis TaxID=1181879 RepID=A0A840IWA1_9PSEU|nr:betaine/proline/choline family ABC transporter ATP-binding protein [Amycolatopsis jiangsuensis]MBB4685492.1 glycine betaine/proline transport system ATP-binding protein [Amycolatopsis jiangsuensis]